MLYSHQENCFDNDIIKYRYLFHDMEHNAWGIMNNSLAEIEKIFLFLGLVLGG